MKVLFFITIFFLFTQGSNAQVFPYVETFDSYVAAQPMGTQGGIVSSAHVYVTSFGLEGNGVEFRMTDTSGAAYDTLTSPLIGPLTAHSIASFYFRVVTLSNGIPSVYAMTGGDHAVIYVGTSSFTIAAPQDTINSSSQNTTTSYKKVVVPIPGFLSTYSGKFRIIVSNPDRHNWLLQMDSLVVKDTVPVLPVLTDSISNVACRGQSTGSIKVLVSGIAPPYHYLWSTGDTTQVISGQFAGSYTVTVTDNNGVTASLSGAISEPAFAMIFDSLSQTPVLCYGANTGIAAVYTSGGNLPYHYTWSTTPLTHSNPATGLYAGNYTVTVTDANGCLLTALIHISQPSAAFSIASSATPSSGSDGTATVSAIGGSATTTYLWSTNPPQTTATAVGLAAGYVVVTVTNGSCHLIDSIYVPHPSGIGSVNSDDLILYPNPADGELFIEHKGKQTLATTIQIMDMSGRLVREQEVLSNSINSTSLANGLYVIRIFTRDRNYITKILIQH